MQVKKTKIPPQSSLYSNRTKYDYIDSYECLFVDPDNKLNIVIIGDRFIKPGPKWFENLFKLRNKIAAIFNLKASNETSDIGLVDKSKWEVGSEVGIFKVFAKTTNEIILGEDDTHLNFRVSLLLETHADHPSKKICTITTIVQYNNLLGEIYFFFVKPFHQLAIPILLKRNFNGLQINQ